MKFSFSYLNRILFLLSVLNYNYIFISLFISILGFLTIIKDNFIFNIQNILLIFLLFIIFSINLINGIKTLKLNYKASFLSGPWIFIFFLLFAMNETVLSYNTFYDIFYYTLSFILGVKSIISSFNFKFHCKLNEIAEYFNLDNSGVSLISKHYGSIYYTIYKNGMFYHLNEQGESKYLNIIEYQNIKYPYEKVLNYLNENNKTINDLSLEDLKLLDIYLY